MCIKTVFISYSHDDSNVVDKLKAALEEKCIVVRIDKAVMEPGENIRKFIENSISNTDVTISIISNRSLISAWVAMESVAAFYSESLQRNKRFIACYIDKDFIRDDYQFEVIKQIEEKIDAINKLIQEGVEKKLDTVALNNKRSMYIKLRNNVGDILLRLTECECLDIREDKFDESVARIVKYIPHTVTI